MNNSILELKNQVCSLALAEQLWELEVPQQSYFKHFVIKDRFKSDTGYNKENIAVSVPYTYLEKHKEGKHKGKNKLYAAYTVSELMELLPHYYQVRKTKLGNTDTNQPFETSYACYEPENSIDEEEERAVYVADTAADATASMLIHLIKEENYKPE